MSISVSDFQKTSAELLRAILCEYGLQNLSVECLALADSDKYLLRTSHCEEIARHDLYAGEFPDILLEKYKPLIDDIQNSPYIASLKARHASEVETLKEQIKTLEKQNMKLSHACDELAEAFTDGMEMLEQDSAEE